MKNISFKRVTTLILTIAISTFSAFAQDSVEVVEWLKTTSFPLKNHTAGNGFEDLQPLKETLREVSVVGLGEATHGTREYFQFKHRMIEFLVRELGFTVFVMEVQYFKCLPINEYVLNGSDNTDVEKLINTNLSGIYRTEEVLELVKWIHQYNKTVPSEKKVKFFGFDIQTPHQAADFLRSFFKKVDAEYLIKSERDLNETAPQSFQKFWTNYSRRTIGQKNILSGKLLQMLGFLVKNESRFVRKSSKGEFETALQATRILVQSDQIRNTPEAKLGTDENPRDKFMAETVEYILNHEPNGTKAILWAHNFHLWKYNPNSNVKMTKIFNKHDLSFRPMGNYLKEFFGEKYYSFGFVMDTGSFQAIDDEAGDDVIEPLEFTLKSSPVGSLGWYFSQTKLGDSLIDLRKKSNKKDVVNWLTSPHQMRYAGASFSNKWKEDEFALPVIPRESFDGFIFIEHTTRARSLPYKN